MTNIYDQHRTAFKNIRAYVVLRNGERIATIATKYGNCRCTAYVHLIGIQMQKGIANGGGYDMASAAIANGFNKPAGDVPAPSNVRDLEDIRAALKDDGRHWYDAMREAGFQVLEAV